MNPIMQNIITITIPQGATWYADDFRKTVRACVGGDDSFNGLHELFNFQEDGHSMNNKPLCRFIGTKKTVGFVSERKNGQEDVSKIAGHIINAANKHFHGKDLGLKIFQQEKEIRFTSEPITYRLVGGVKKGRTDAIRAMTKEQRQDIAPQVTEKMIKTMLEDALYQELFDDLPPFNTLDFVLHEIRPLSVQITEKSKEVATLVNATFSINADLAGYWQAGQLQARGYGLLHKFKGGY